MVEHRKHWDRGAFEVDFIQFWYVRTYILSHCVNASLLGNMSSSNIKMFFISFIVNLGNLAKSTSLRTIYRVFEKKCQKARELKAQPKLVTTGLTHISKFTIP